MLNLYLHIKNCEPSLSHITVWNIPQISFPPLFLNHFSVTLFSQELKPNLNKFRVLQAIIGNHLIKLNEKLNLTHAESQQQGTKCFYPTNWIKSWVKSNFSAYGSLNKGQFYYLDFTRLSNYYFRQFFIQKILVILSSEQIVTSSPIRLYHMYTLPFHTWHISITTSLFNYLLSIINYNYTLILKF